MARYAIALASARLFGAAFWGTLAVNVIGCAVMGALFAYLVRRPDFSEGARLALATGFLGGFTTFSAFALDTAQFWMRAEWGAAFAYALASVVFSLAGLSLGMYAMRAG